MSNYPLYDVPYLVRESNWCWMSKTRQEIEKRNQAIVDDYFIARDQGASAYAARKQVAQKHEIGRRRVDYCLRWYYQEAVRRKKYDFLIKFPPAKEHIVQFERIFALDFKNQHNHDQEPTLQNHRNYHNGHCDLCSYRTGTHLLQCDANHFHAVTVLPKRRYNLHHRHKNHRNLRCFKETRVLTLKNVLFRPYATRTHHVGNTEAIRQIKHFNLSPLNLNPSTSVGGKT